MSLPEQENTSAMASPRLPLSDAWARYEAIRDRLPSATSRPVPRRVDGLLEVADEFDGFLFDSFGVLNVGETAIPGADACLAALRRMGKSYRVLTNAASYTSDAALSKYRRMGLDVARAEIVSSRDVTFAHLDHLAPGIRWGAIAAEGDRFPDAGASEVFDMLARGTSWDDAEGIVFLSAARWTAALQDRLVADLIRRPRPVVVGNPDLVAPREDGLSVEPGFWAHDLQDRTGVVPRFFGKPFAEAFDSALGQMGPGRYAMIGDTLHTDILGGQAAGLSTILVTDHGLFAGRDPASFIAESGILPDIVMPSI
jgi:HAD superfamily hydrolase (TIGR01450 family)